MSISTQNLQEKVFTLLANAANEFERAEKIDTKKCICFLSDEERIRCNSYCKISELSTLPNEFALIFCNRKNEKFILVSSRLNCEMNSADFELQENSFAELGVLVKKDKLSLVRNLNTRDILDKVLIYDDPRYKGNSFKDLEGFFQPFSVYKIRDDLPIKESDDYCLYSYFLMNYSNSIESKFEDATIQTLDNLLFSGVSIPYYNIVLALNSQQWNHVFLETYRMIEHVFPAVSLKKVTEKMAPKTTQDIAAVLEEITGWRPTEDRAIEEIFKEIEVLAQFGPLLDEIRDKVIKNPQQAIFKWYYKQVRNQIVHYRAIHKNVIFSDAEWNILVRFNVSLVQYLYDTYKDQIEIGDQTFSDN